MFTWTWIKKKDRKNTIMNFIYCYFIRKSTERQAVKYILIENSDCRFRGVMQPFLIPVNRWIFLFSICDIFFVVVVASFCHSIAIRLCGINLMAAHQNSYSNRFAILRMNCEPGRIDVASSDKKLLKQTE